ncbi:alpha-1,6-glucosidase domain-containing protein [Gemmatimonas phototrophica]|uniref:alpha-1,6-glucosidase domain-containing protein n=1 Tax=Gemmatimonas phototrophica TaxID=1379270 RepID=UPI0009EEB35C|nr:alpha-1,6-glucosidase domain-containing protein [Gemmatimonas phototrophica]
MLASFAFLRPAATVGLLSLLAPPRLQAAVAPTASDTVAVQSCTQADAATVLHRELLAAPLDARGIWLDARTVRWPGAPTPTAGERYVVYGNPTGSLRLTTGGPVGGATDTVHLEPYVGPLATATAAQVRHVGAGVTLRIPSSRRRPFRATGQLVLAREDAMGRLVEVTGTQRALALDALHGPLAQPRTLGAATTATATTFALWAPTAQQVSVCLYTANKARVLPLTANAGSGVWQAPVAGVRHGVEYTYLVDVYVPGVGMVRNRVTDPYSLALTANSARSVVVNLQHPTLVPDGWGQRRAPPLTNATDQVIYELHVRDFSVQDSTVPAAHRGRYLAFTDTASVGMQHLRSLANAGLTDVHLLPVFDIATIPELGCRTPEIRGSPDGETQQTTAMDAAAGDCFNWGYDPLHYTVPEGSYATNASDFAARIREFRRMVQALNGSGLRVGMDVVYNHTSASGQHASSVLDRIVPGYYHRLDATGRVETSTCCANTATEHRMMAKLMIESAVTWVRHYGISSFRFDLMGHQPRAAMEALQRAVNAAAGRVVPLIGEGWNFGEVADGRRFVQASQLSLNGSGIATFSDRARDAIRGGSPMDDGADQVRHQGFVNGLGYAPNEARAIASTPGADRAALATAADLVRVGLAGSLRSFAFLRADGSTGPLSEIRYGGSQPAGYVTSPGEVVNYVENHDNLTLFDINILKLPANTSGEDRARVQHLASALALFSQGIAYVHAGQELLRSKSLDRNSFDSGDWFNVYDPSGLTHGFSRGLPPRRDNAASWPVMQPRLANTGLVPTPSQVQWTREAFKDLLRIRASTPLFRLPSADAVMRRLRFANVGASQEPTVVVGHLDGRGLANAGFADVLYAVNVDVIDHEIPVPFLQGQPLQLHPVHRASGATDTRARASVWTPSTGLLRVPARTAVVWVRE